MRFIHSSRFWTGTIITFFFSGIFFSWELNLLSFLGISGFARPVPTTMELILTVFIAILFSVNIGLFLSRKKEGSCPTGSKTATGLAGAIGAFALICPACALGSFGFISITGAMIMISPYAPLLQMIAVILLSASLVLLMNEKR